MHWPIQPIPFKPHRLKHFGETSMINHYERNYGGAVQRLNRIMRDWQARDAATPGYMMNGLGREYLLAHNSAVLHEVYFAGLGGAGGDPVGGLAAQLRGDFDGIDRWRRELTAMGLALAGGSGWVLLSWSWRMGRLMHQWAADHAHLMADTVPILALDMYEHAYQPDFGPDAGRYIAAFLDNLDWQRLDQRFQTVMNRGVPGVAAEHAEDFFIPPEALAAQRGQMRLLDVRLAEDYAEDPTKIPGAEWVDPEKLEAWASQLNPAQPLVVYCHYGMQVCQAVVNDLRARGVAARALAGGISAWRAMGGQTE